MPHPAWLLLLFIRISPKLPDRLRKRDGLVCITPLLRARTANAKKNVLNWDCRVTGRDVHAKVRSHDIESDHLRLPDRGSREAARDVRHGSWFMGKESWSQTLATITNLRQEPGLPPQVNEESQGRTQLTASPPQRVVTRFSQKCTRGR